MKKQQKTIKSKSSKMKNIQKTKQIETKPNGRDWKPFCFGNYQGVGDDSCFICPISRQCHKLAELRNKKTTCFYCGDSILGNAHKEICLGGVIKCKKE
jgi:hypothetical protein